MSNYDELRKKLKENEVLGIDTEINKIYKSPKGTIVKIFKKIDIGGNIEIHGYTENKVPVKIPPDIILTLAESSSFNDEDEKIINKKIIKNIKKEVKHSMQPEIKNEIKNKKSDEFEKIKNILKNLEGCKINKKSIVFNVDGVKCTLYANDLMVLAKSRLNGVREPNKVYKDCVRYHISDLYEKLNIKV